MTLQSLKTLLVATALCSGPSIWAAALPGLGGTMPEPAGAPPMASAPTSRLTPETAARPAASWSENSTTDASGVHISRYLDDRGLVFAVRWQGPFKPNLTDLLGPYFAQVSPGYGSKRVIWAGDLVVHSTGFMGHFTGYAYLRSKTPAGFAFAPLQGQ